MLALTNVTKSIKGKKLLDMVSLEIPAGTITALLGPTGAGKTSLLRALALIDQPDSGSISIDGIGYQFPNTEFVDSEIWPKTTVVFQDLFLWPHLSNRDNIILPLKLRKVKSHPAIVESLIELLTLDGFIDRFPNEVSRGQRQIIAIARALALEPKYLLLDEVTVSLDVLRAAKVAEVLRSRSANGMGILIITHQLAFARTTASRVAFMQDSRIEELGPSSILDSPQTECFKQFVKAVGSIA